MEKLKSIIGIFFAIFAVFAAYGTFFGFPMWEKKIAGVADANGVKIDPWWIGAGIESEIKHGGFTTRVHKAYSKGILWKDGLLQVDWGPVEKLPATFRETVNIMGIGEIEFEIKTSQKFFTATPVDTHSVKILNVEHKLIEVNGYLSARVYYRPR